MSAVRSQATPWHHSGNTMESHRARQNADGRRLFWACTEQTQFLDTRAPYGHNSVTCMYFTEFLNWLGGAVLSISPRCNRLRSYCAHFVVLQLFECRQRAVNEQRTMNIVEAPRHHSQSPTRWTRHDHDRTQWELRTCSNSLDAVGTPWERHYVSIITKIFNRTALWILLQRRDKSNCQSIYVKLFSNWW